MKSTAFVSVMTVAFLLNACSAKKADAGKDAAAVSADSDVAAASNSEHCKDDKGQACFVENEVDGRSVFYTNKAGYQAFLTSPGLQDASITLTQISDEEYQQKLADTVTPRLNYGQSVNVNLDVVNEDGSLKPIPGREANARLPTGLLKNKAIFSKFSGILKGGKGAGGIGAKLKGFLGKGGKSSGIFGKLLGGGKKSGGGVFKKIAIALGVGGLFGYASASGGEAQNARISALGKDLDVAMNISLGADSVQEDVTME